MNLLRRHGLRVLLALLAVASVAFVAHVAYVVRAAWPPGFAGWSNADWSAFGQVGALTVASVTGPLILWQVIEARKSREQHAEQARQQSDEQTTREQRRRQDQADREQNLREEQARPFVVVDFDPSEAWGGLLELVFRNLGRTMARDVRTTFSPELKSTLIEKGQVNLLESSLLRDGIPMLPPGKEFRLLFERMPDLHSRPDLPRRYDVSIIYKDAHEWREYEDRYELDLDIYFGWSYVERYGVHHIGKELRDIRKTMKSWTTKKGLRAWVRDEKSYVVERDREYEKRIREVREWQQGQSNDVDNEG